MNRRKSLFIALLLLPITSLTAGGEGENASLQVEIEKCAAHLRTLMYTDNSFIKATLADALDNLDIARAHLQSAGDKSSRALQGLSAADLLVFLNTQSQQRGPLRDYKKPKKTESRAIRQNTLDKLRQIGAMMTTAPKQETDLISVILIYTLEILEFSPDDEQRQRLLALHDMEMTFVRKYTGPVSHIPVVLPQEIRDRVTEEVARRFEPRQVQRFIHTSVDFVHEQLVRGRAKK